MSNDRFLRLALRANALFSFVAGGLALTAGGRIAEGVRLPSWMVVLTGASLIGYSAALAILAQTKRPASAWAVSATVLDIAWVLGSCALSALHEFEVAHWVVLVAAFVAGFAVMQLEGMRRATFGADGAGRFSSERRVQASGERAWAVISDVERYAEVAGTLHSSVVVSGSGVGMVRKCEDKNGSCWLESCSRWEPGRAYAFDVDTSGPKYPLPLRTMRGDFEVFPAGTSSSTIRIRFTFTARGGWLTQVLLGVTFAARGASIVGAILGRWADRIEEPPSCRESLSGRVASPR